MRVNKRHNAPAAMLPIHQNSNLTRPLQNTILQSTRNPVLAPLHLTTYLQNTILQSTFSHLLAPLHLSIYYLQNTFLQPVNQSMQQHQPRHRCRWHRSQRFRHGPPKQHQPLGVCKQTHTQQPNRRAFCHFHPQGKGLGKSTRERTILSASECPNLTHGFRDFQAFP